jgi:hypothetical protein
VSNHDHANEHGAGPGGLGVPPWLAGDMSVWWPHALGAPGATAHLEPMGVDHQRRLAVAADSLPYATQLRAAAAVVARHVNERVPEADLAGVVVVMRPVIVLVVTAAEFTGHDLLADVLLETWHDAVQDVGPAHPVVFQHVDETPADRVVTWHVSCGAGFRLPRGHRELADHAVQMRNAALIDDGPGCCLAF